VPAPAALATPGDLNSYLQRELDPGTAELLLGGASAIVRRYVGWPLSVTTETFARLGNGSVVLGLPTLALRAVTEVRVAGAVLGTADYLWTPDGTLVRPGGWGRLTPVEVDAEHGLDPVPEDVRLVTLVLAAKLVANPDRVQWQAVGTISNTFPAGVLTEMESALLDPYRAP